MPRYLIRKYSQEKDYILDPMCGSGTVILEAMLEGRNSIGIDIDPIAEMITKTKTKPISPKTLEKCRQIIFREMLTKVAGKYHPKIPEFNYRDVWFKPFILRELAIIKESIDSIESNGYSKNEAEKLQRFFNVIFSSIIRDISNADPHCTRTVIRKNLNKNIKEWDAVLKFFSSADKQIAHMEELYNKYQFLKQKPKIKIKKNDAKHTKLDGESIGLAITSPPYVNAVDYPRTHQLEMYWLGLIKNQSLSDMKRKYIGTETVYKKDYSELKESGYPQLDTLVEKIFKKDPRRSYIVYKFFKDMESNLCEIKRVLKKGGRYCIVIGNNAIRGYEVESHKILCEIATSKNVGFELEKKFYSGVINHFIKIPRKERMLGEWVIILKKPVKVSPQVVLNKYHSN